MPAELITVIAGVVAAVIGGLSGYLAACSQSRQSRESALDKLAQELAKMEMERDKEVGRISPYSSIAHWVVLRELLRRHDSDQPGISVKQLRDAVHGLYTKTCAGRPIPSQLPVPAELIPLFQQLGIEPTADSDGTPLIDTWAVEGQKHTKSMKDRILLDGLLSLLTAHEAYLPTQSRAKIAARAPKAQQIPGGDSGRCADAPFGTPQE